MKLRIISDNELKELAMLDAKANLSPWSLFNYQASAKNPQHVLLGAFSENDLLLGACVYSKVLDEAEILQLVIRYEKQRNGYAYKLLDYICGQLKAESVSQVFLEVMVGNTPAISLYHKLGFNVISTRKNYYKVADKDVDALLMAYEL